MRIRDRRLQIFGKIEPLQTALFQTQGQQEPSDIELVHLFFCVLKVVNRPFKKHSHKKLLLGNSHDVVLYGFQDIIPKFRTSSQDFYQKKHHLSLAFSVKTIPSFPGERLPACPGPSRPLRSPRPK